MNKNVVVLGDMNLCSHKWERTGYPLKTLSNEVKMTLSECGMTMADLGPSYFSDHKNRDGTISSSYLDHIYYVSKWIVSCSVLDGQASDHVPIMAKISLKDMTKEHKQGYKTIKNTDFQAAKQTLAAMPWGSFVDMNVEEQVMALESYICCAISDATKERQVKVHRGHIPGMSKKIKELMKQRNNTHRRMRRAEGPKKAQLHLEYKTLRNKCLSMQRKQTESYYENKFLGLANPKVLWGAVKSVVSPQSTNSRKGWEHLFQRGRSGQLFQQVLY